MIQFLKDISLGILLGFGITAFILLFAFIGNNLARLLFG
jgi:hypothetical protein